MIHISVYITIAFFLLFTILLAIKGYKRVKKQEVYVDDKINVKWWVIGLSLFATDISLGYIIGTSGRGFEKGLAVGSYGWTSSIVMIIVAIYILPKYMRLGIQTLPEYLELRFSPAFRFIVAILFILFIVFNGLSLAYYSFSVLIINALEINSFWQFPAILFIGIFSGILLFSGGLQSAFRFDILVALLVLLGGITVFSFSIYAVGGFNNLVTYSQGKLTSVLPSDDNFVPWTQVFFGGIWLLHLNYWALFQPMTQKVVSVEHLSQAQKGMLLTATLKLIVPFLFLIPGIICFELYSDQVTKPEDVFTVILKNTLPISLGPIIIIAFATNVISTSYAFLHASGMMFSKDIYSRFINPKANDAQTEKVYFIAIFSCILGAIVMAPYVTQNKFIVDLNLAIRFGFLPGIIVVFLMGLFISKGNHSHAWLALSLSLPLYFITKHIYPLWIDMHVLGINTLIIAFVTLLYIAISPNEFPIRMLGKREIRFERNLGVVIWSIFIVTLVFGIYMIFL